jgi:betaine-aldehyde dehydrogenase
VRSHSQLYIDGQWTDPSGKESIDVLSASTEEVMGRIPRGDPADVDRAVRAAAAAFPAWSATPVDERARWLECLRDGLGARAEEIATTIAGEVGTPLKIAKAIQAGLPVVTAGNFAALIREFPLEERVGNSIVVHEPLGVVGAITPWNYPLHQILGKVAPALAAGCTVVLKPSEVAPLNAFILAEIVHSIGLPRGVFNLVSGFGPEVGEALARHPLVDMISFTGSTRAGRRVSELAAGTIKRVSLELGGKSPSVVLDDADLQAAIPGSVSNCYLNSGQTCSAWTRLLVPRGQHDAAVEIAKAAASKFTVGDPLGGQATLGPLVSAAQRDRVRAYIRKGVEEGARLVLGGAEPPPGLPKGYYVQPTVFADVAPQMTIAQEEIFGPVLSILPYEDEEDAIRIANGTPYGLAGAVWSKDPARAQRVARRLRTGQVHVNGGKFNPLAPFGGYKQSGNGREFGKYGLTEYFEIKSMQT